MKYVTLRFIGVGYNNLYQAKVIVYDNKGCLVASGTTYNGTITFCLREKYFYNVVATFCNEKINKYFYINNNNNYIFVFNHAYMKQNMPSQRIITFLLNDANYANLPIEKGEIILWQKQ